MRGSSWRSAAVGFSSLAFVLGDGACAGPSASTPGSNATATIQQVPLAAPPPEPPPRPKLTTSIVDDERPRTFDGDRKNPGMATLRGVSEREAWVAFSVIDGESYEAIVNLETGCVTETLDAVGPHAVARLLLEGTNDGEILGRLMSEDVQRRVGAHLALLARFEQNKISAVMVKKHSDGQAVVSQDHRKLALIAARKIFLSVDGGRSFARADRDPPAAIDGLIFSADDRYLLFRSYDPRHEPRVSGAQLTILDTTAPAAAVKLDTEHFVALQVSSPEGLLLFSHETDRCIYGVDPSAPALKPLSCVAGPKIAKDHFFFTSLSPSGRFGMELQGDFQATRGIVFAVDGKTKPRTLKGAYELHNVNVGPDDEGRYAWENRPPGVLRIDSRDGVRDTRMTGTPLGFDLQGNVLVFQQPPLVRPHKPMTMMPPAKGTLADTRCSLVRRVAL